MLLRRWAAGCADSGARLMERLYPDLRRLALHHRWDLDLSAQPSDLAQDLFLRLSDQRRTAWQDRAHFFAVAAKLIRRVVVDHLRHRHRLKRGGEAEHVEVEEARLAIPGVDLEVLALDEALGRLAEISPSAVQVVELRFFTGLSVEETAAVLDVGRATVIRRWRFARAWLRDALGSEA